MSGLAEIQQPRKAADRLLLEMDSRVYKAFVDMECAAFADGELTAVAKELIAVGISVVIDRESCMQRHVEQAAGRGATRQQVLEAVEVGIETGGGPATVPARFALEVMDVVFGEGCET
jgi:AhpD family alkylhydroperoxidase